MLYLKKVESAPVVQTRREALLQKSRSLLESCRLLTLSDLLGIGLIGGIIRKGKQ